MVVAAEPARAGALYLVSDGVYDKIGQWFVIWPVVDLMERNVGAGEDGDHATRQQLVGFGDDGTGDPFCVPRDGSAGVSSGIPSIKKPIR